MKPSIICLFLLVTSSCSLYQTEKESEQHQVVEANISKPEISLVDFSVDLASQFYDAKSVMDERATIAVGSFTPIDTLAFDQQSDKHFKVLGLQLAAGLSAAMTQQGFRIIEYKLRNTISIKPDQDLMLSRNVSDLQGKHSIDYFLTGTLTQHHQGISVNARLIDAKSKVVVAAVTDTLARSAWWPERRTMVKNGLIFRSSK
jgi:TolB-like protein